MGNLYHFFIRVSAFIGKEIFAILRQPMLVLTLVLGPFLILLLFGVGFRTEARALKTLFVVDPASNMAQEVESYVSTLGPQLIYMGITGDAVKATQSLIKREVDVVATIPSDAYETIRNSEQAVFELKYYEIDPFLIDYISIFGKVYADEINRRILHAVTQRTQQETASVDDTLHATRQSTAKLHQAVEADNQAEARQHRQALKNNMDDLTLVVGAAMGVTEGVQQTVGANNNPTDTEAITTLLSSVQENVNTLENQEDSQSADTQSQSQVENIAKIEEDLAALDELLQEFRDIDAQVLVSPFRSEATNIAATQLRASDFFAPAVIVLLLQHLAVTFGALSIVKERQIGAMELFRVSPISPFETIMGKYISYLLFATVLTVILTSIVIFGLAVPMLGNWLYFSLSLAALLFASLGFGFVISLLAETDSAAVQYSMIMLLTSVFFSGAFVGLHSLWEPVRVVSWMLPATYGILLLQNIMLRGLLDNSILLLLGLAGMGFALFLVAWLLLRRQMARS